MELRIIKNDEQHRRYLQEARRLAKSDLVLDSDDGARLALRLSSGSSSKREIRGQLKCLTRLRA